MNYLPYFIPITCQPLHIATIYEVITIISDLRLLTDHYLRRGEEEGRRRAGGGQEEEREEEEQAGRRRDTDGTLAGHEEEEEKTGRRGRGSRVRVVMILAHFH